MSFLGFNPSSSDVGDASSEWGLGSFDGVVDVFADWGKKIADIDVYKRAMKAGLTTDNSGTQTTFGTGAGSAGGVTDTFSDDFYKKAGLAVGALALLVTVYAVFFRK